MLIIHGKRKKIYYVPGLISLVFLPFFLFKKIDEVPKPSVIINYFVPASEKYNPVIKYFSGESVMKKLYKKKFLSYYLDGDHELNKTKLRFIRWEALHMKFTNDTTHVLRVRLGEGLSYGEFVYLLNMMVVDDHSRYFEWENVFYIFNFSPLNNSYMQHSDKSNSDTLSSITL